MSPGSLWFYNQTVAVKFWCFQTASTEIGFRKAELLFSFEKTYRLLMFSSWTPDNFFNISRIDLNPHELWIPDIIFFTQLSGSHFNQDFPSQPALLFDGMTMVLKPFRTELVCVMDVWFFPYDRQVSDLLLPSLTITLNCIFKNV